MSIGLQGGSVIIYSFRSSSNLRIEVPPGFSVILQQSIHTNFPGEHIRARSFRDLPIQIIVVKAVTAWYSSIINRRSRRKHHEETISTDAVIITVMLFDDRVRDIGRNERSNNRFR